MAEYSYDDKLIITNNGTLGNVFPTLDVLRIF